MKVIEKVKLPDKGFIEPPKSVREKFRLEKDVEFDLLFDSETISKVGLQLIGRYDV